MPSRSEEIEALYNAERLRLERMVVRTVGASNAGDVVQDVFAAIWAKAREHVKLSPSYLTQAVKYSAISRFRAECRRKAFFGGITEEQYSAPVVMPEQIVSAREDLKRLEVAMLALSTRTRQIFLLNRVHGCTYEEIAIGLNVSYSTVEREMAKAILSCKGAR